MSGACYVQALSRHVHRVRSARLRPEVGRFALYILMGGFPLRKRPAGLFASANAVLLSIRTP